MSQFLGHTSTQSGTGVTHDPLCTWRQAEEADAGDPCRWLAGGLAVCDCDKIAKVREDMLAKCIAAVWESGLYDMEKEAIGEILRALQEKP